MKLISRNKYASRDNQLIDKYTAGIELLGPEVKPIKHGDISINESQIKIKKGEIFLVGANVKFENIDPFFTVEPTRDRRLLLNKSEIKKIRKQVDEKKLKLIPTSIILNGRGLIKVNFYVGRSLNVSDKRELEKKRDFSREKKLYI